MPPSASSNRPGLSRTASVNAPRAWPNSSDSSSGPGIAAQLIATKRRCAPRRGVVDRACDELLASPGLAEHQHRRAGRGDDPDHLLELLHRRAITDERRRDGRDLRAPRQLRDVPQRQLDRELVERLGDDVRDARRDQHRHRRELARPQHGDHRRPARHRAQLRRELCGGEHHAADLGVEVPPRGLEVAGGGHARAAPIDQQMQRTPRFVIGTDEQHALDPRGRGHGTSASIRGQQKKREEPSC